MEDQILQCLKNLSGNSNIWDGLDTSGWNTANNDGWGVADDDMNSHLSEGPPSESRDEDMITPGTNAEWDSDDSAGLLFNVNKLTKVERVQAEARGYKLSKARAFASDEPVVPKKDPRELEKVDWKETGLTMGDLSPETEEFVPWPLVQGYVERFVGKRNSSRAAPYFTLEALHENRVWDLYYLHSPPPKIRPMLFVPTYQFEHLLEVINAELEVSFTIPPGKNQWAFRLRFGFGGTPRPRFLGRSTSADSFRDLRNQIPPFNFDDDLNKATKEGQQYQHDIFYTINSLIHMKKGSKSDKNRLKWTYAHRSWGRSIKRVQRYLGLRCKVSGDDAPLSEMPPSLSLEKVIPYEPEGLPVFIAIDLEAWERNNNLITEVGIAVLDTQRIRTVPPGRNGKNWFDLISARHIRVKENAWARNERFVLGCPDRFNFGLSELIKRNDIPLLLRSMIDENLSKKDKDMVSEGDDTPKPRSVVLVFHEASSDLKLLLKIGYNAYTAENVIDVVDTREMYQCLTRSNDSSSLASILTDCNIDYCWLHNAGNDAVYTLQAMIALSVKARTASLERVGKPKATHVPFAEFQEKEGWTSGGEDSDGGDPVKPMPPLSTSPV